MNGFITKSLAAWCVAASLVGCCAYEKLVDPCWPERYNAQARHGVIDIANAQAYNGHVLDQTVWNYHFETDLKTGLPSDRLTPGGMQHLTYLVRRRPSPDPKVYLQTAQDIVYNPALTPEKLIEARSDLDNRRQAAVHKFLSAQAASRHLGYDFEILVHDPAEVGIAATPVGGNQRPRQVDGATQELYGNFRGTMAGAAGVLGSGSGGGGGGGGSGGGTGGASTAGTGTSGAPR